ncbi:baculoviral IAP repeat-containing protein 7-A-like [Haliotis rubra]|uniref:baculoviral IAP repeat-containing protein 7-A-like n=1 Tax=Haliotis rubra TaxID=36100 RepID=UPI001EE5E1C6|nr:baculoviral IAP repeat-containing protein 7-A-like [Haliotis rubra]XP_046582309.1 baculoviral IAP repeat-containing protein 7-A-like [Haliotis rubra]
MDGTKHAGHFEAKSRITDPKHPGYQLIKSRLDSFVAWPRRYVPKTPEELASAGFFYIGSADRVTCFQCGITLRDWEEEHDPVAEHQKYSEHCQFINKTDLNQLGVATRKLGAAQAVSKSDDSSNQNTREAFTEQVAGDTRTECATGGHIHEKETDETNMNAAIGGAVSDNPSRKSNNACVSAGACGQDINGGSERWTPSLVKPLSVNEEVKYSINNVTHMFNDSLSMESAGRESMTKRAVSGSPSGKRSGKNTATKSVKTENRRLRAQVMCRLCQTAEVNVVFLPCGHLITCAPCSARVETCPVCTKIIAGTVKAFMA